MSNSASLGALQYAVESTFGEISTSISTWRLPVVGDLDMSGLTHGKLEPNRLVQYRNDTTPHILGTMGGSFKVTMHLAGHGSATSGATTLTETETFLGHILGASAVSAASGTTASAGTASALTTVASGTFTAGSLFRLGALGDARGNGQWGVVSSHAATTLTSLTAFAAGPSGSDVVYSAATINVLEQPTASALQSFRFFALSANQRYRLYGCYPTSVEFGGLSPGAIPTVTITFSVAHWTVVSAGTNPSVVSTDMFQPSPVAAGSLFLNAVGTAARSTRTYRDFTLSYQFGSVAQRGPGGANAYQDIVGCKRTTDGIKVTIIEDAEAAADSPVLDSYFLGANKYHLLNSLSVQSGSALAFYFPQLYVTGARPVQSNRDGINSTMIELTAGTGPTVTTELTSSAFRMGFA